MPTEEQTLDESWISVRASTYWRVGQQLTISGRTVDKLSFKLHKSGGVETFDVVFTIRRVSDDSIIASKVWGLGDHLTADPAGAWYEVTFDTPVAIDEEVRICVEYDGDQILFHMAITDPKASESQKRYNGVWSFFNADWDCCYIYTYDLTPTSVGGLNPGMAELVLG